MSIFSGSPASYTRFWIVLGVVYLVLQGVVIYLLVTRPLLAILHRLHR